MTTLLIILLFFAVIASTWWFGIWSNILTLINLLLAGLIASSYYEILAVKLAPSMPQFKKVLPFLSVWILFVATYLLLRLATDIISTKRVKFEKMTELVGQSILSIWVAAVFIAFTTFTLHLSPLPPAAFQSTPEGSTLGIGPDRFWLAFIQSRSRGALSSSKAKNMFAAEAKGSSHPDDADLDARVFDPNGKFIPENINRRAGLANSKTIIDVQSFTIDDGE